MRKRVKNLDELKEKYYDDNLNSMEFYDNYGKLIENPKR